MKIDALERKGWEMLDNSELPKVKTIEKSKANGTIQEHVKEIQERTGNIRILEFLRQCNRDRLEILCGNFNKISETEKSFSKISFDTYDVSYRVVELPIIE